MFHFAEKISYKLTALFLVFTLAIAAYFYLAGVQNQKKNYESFARENITNLKANFNNLEERDTKMLLSNLELIVRDPSIKAEYLKKDREGLYNYVLPVFRDLRDKYGITHFYFILPDGRVFLRMHDKGLYGDLVKRFSFEKARETKGPGTEIELGKTAFALRAVMPYFSGRELIGYVELGEEIDHFLHILKGAGNNEFGIIADKEFLDREDWRSVRREAGLRDNWDDLERHLVLAGTSREKIAAECFTEDSLKRVGAEGNIVREVRNKGRTFICGGFGFSDARGRHIGAVLSLMDISEYVALADKANRGAMRAALAVFLVIFSAGLLISRTITRPIHKLAEAAKAIAGGDLGRRVQVSSRDEIGQLGRSFNQMLEKRQLAAEEKENLILELRDALSNVKTLKGLLPICAWCKKIRDDSGYWKKLETYLQEHSEASFTHGICPACLKKVDPDVYGSAVEAESAGLALGMEKRREERVKFTGNPGEIRHLDLKNARTVPILNAAGEDISDSGICIGTDYPLAPGHIVLFRDGTEAKAGVVRWRKPPEAGVGLSRAGIKFIWFDMKLEEALFKPDSL
jgi:HAMP domain-containing protein